MEVELRDGGAFEHVRDWASKLPGNVARVAALLHCVEDTEPDQRPIPLETLDAALALGALFERHALAVFALMAANPAIEAAHKVWSWITRVRHQAFSKRDCFRGVQSQTFPDVASVDGALQVLVERSFLFPLPHEPRAGRPSPGFRVNRRFTEAWS